MNDSFRLTDRNFRRPRTLCWIGADPTPCVRASPRVEAHTRRPTHNTHLLLFAQGRCPMFFSPSTETPSLSLPQRATTHTTRLKWELDPLYSLYFIPHRASLHRVLIIVCCKRLLVEGATTLNGGSCNRCQGELRPWTTSMVTVGRRCSEQQTVPRVFATCFNRPAARRVAMAQGETIFCWNRRAKMLRW